MPSAKPKRLVMMKRGSTESGWGCHTRMNTSRPTFRAVAVKTRKESTPMRMARTARGQRSFSGWRSWGHCSEVTRTLQRGEGLGGRPESPIHCQEIDAKLIHFFIHFETIKFPSSFDSVCHVVENVEPYRLCEWTYKFWNRCQTALQRTSFT